MAGTVADMFNLNASFWIMSEVHQRAADKIPIRSDKRIR